MEEQNEEMKQKEEMLEDEAVQEETLETEEIVEEEKIEEKVETVFKKESSNPKKTKKQKLQIMISAIVLIVVIIGIVIFFLLNGKDTKKKESSNSSNTNSNSNAEEPVSHQEIINQYGTKLDELVDSYSKQNGKVPDLAGLLEYAKVGEHKISCKEQKITSSKKVYLGECSVDDSKETYNYGEKEELKTSGKDMDVFKVKTSYGIEYRFELYDDDKNNFTKVATIPCEGINCAGYAAFEQYAVVVMKKILNNNEELWYYHLYDYQNNKYLGLSISDPDELEVLEYDNKFYGIYYNKNGQDYLYTVQTGKTFKINGQYRIDMGWDPSPMLSVGYAAVINDEVTNFINLKNGSVVYSIKNVSHFSSDSESGNVYIAQYIERAVGEDTTYTYKIYDSKGFALFNGEEFDGFYSENNIIVTWKNGVFKTYNKDYQNTYTSKTYDSVMDIWENYILVLDENKLNLIDYKGNVLTTFINNWSDDKYYYHSMISGWYTENGKNGIYLLITGDNVSKSEILKNNPDMTEEELNEYELGYEYYYIPTTKETGKIATFIGGYAKPVLYLYPVLPTLVNVTFKYPNSLTTTYPKYKDSWTVLANSNGDLRDLENKYYYGLYWEESLNHRVDFKEGFYVTKENAIEFLEEKLSIIGLNDRERNEFIMYWLPILEKNGKNLVYFELTEERDSYSPINISPKPNSMLRMAIHVKKVDKETKIKEQKLTTFKRTGFTVVEWGGVTY